MHSVIGMPAWTGRAGVRLSAFTAASPCEINMVERVTSFILRGLDENY